MQFVQVFEELTDHDPALQLRHVPEPTDDHVPAMHAAHTLTLAAINVEYCPAAQFVHAPDDVPATVPENDPALQFRHTSELVADDVDEY